MIAPTIFCDLDDCLIARNYHVLPVISVLRPGALELLAELRKIGPVKMLTSAVHEAAVEENEAHGLGFLPPDIIGREDFSVYDWYESKATLTVEGNYCPGGVLIDNQCPPDTYSEAKLKFLGINTTRLIVVPHFLPGYDDDRFLAAIPTVLSRVKELILGVNA